MSGPSSKDVEQTHGIIKTNEDGRCFFRALVIATNPTMQRVERDANGNIKDIMMRSFEKTEADGLRSRVIGEMSKLCKTGREH